MKAISNYAWLFTAIIFFINNSFPSWKFRYHSDYIHTLVIQFTTPSRYILCKWFLEYSIPYPNHFNPLCFIIRLQGTTWLYAFTLIYLWFNFETCKNSTLKDRRWNFNNRLTYILNFTSYPKNLWSSLFTFRITYC